MAEYGQDLDLLTGYQPLFTLRDGPGLVVQAVFRRWTTDPASEAGRRAYRSECRDIRQLLGARVDQAVLAGWESDLASAARHDERVDGCTVVLSYEGPTKTLTLRAQIQVGTTTAELVIPFDSFDPEVLLNG